MNRYKRKAPKLPVHDKVLILCCGKTEEIYFNHLKSKYNKDLKNVSVRIAHCKHSDPLGIVNEAVTLIDKYDEIWCVFDKDDFTNFDDAIKTAKKHKKINCAFSNEAIEYWFILHFEDKKCLITRKRLNNMMSKEFGIEYDKSNEVITSLCKKLVSMDVEVAEERARIGYEHHKLHSGKKYSDWKSCTSVFMLTKRLREWGTATQ